MNGVKLLKKLEDVAEHLGVEKETLVDALKLFDILNEDGTLNQKYVDHGSIGETGQPIEEDIWNLS